MLEENTTIEMNEKATMIANKALEIARLSAIIKEMGQRFEDDLAAHDFYRRVEDANHKRRVIDKKIDALGCRVKKFCAAVVRWTHKTIEADYELYELYEGFKKLEGKMGVYEFFDKHNEHPLVRLIKAKNPAKFALFYKQHKDIEQTDVALMTESDAWDAETAPLRELDMSFESKEAEIQERKSEKEKVIAELSQLF